MYELLATSRVTRIMEGLRDVRELPQNLRLINRTPIVNATDGEIVAFWEGNVYPADIIPDDQRARVATVGKFVLETNKIPNIKQGEPITQEMLNLLDRIKAGGAIRDDVGVVNNWLMRAMERRLLAVRQTMELMRVGAFLDSLVYSRLGVTFTATFGKPSALKVTTATPWATAASAMPVADIQAHAAVRAETYGKATSRLTMVSATFREMIATTEFREKAAVYNQLVGITSANFPTADIGTMTAIAGRILGYEIELYDAKYAVQNLDGSTSSFSNYWPVGYVGFSDAALDNDPNVVDFANGVVTESVVSSITGGPFGGFGGPAYGPVGYVTPQSPDLNPPGINVWGVARGMPRVLDKSAESYLKVTA